MFTSIPYDLIIPENEEEVKDSYLFLIMDFVQSDLKTVLNHQRELQISETHVITIMYNLLCGINFIHTSGVLHRDIKPANILIDEECRPRICDFGISRTRPKS